MTYTSKSRDISRSLFNRGLERITPHQTALFFFSLMLIAGLVIFRNQGLYPIVMADEYSYSRWSRLLSLSASELPSYLYFVTYRVTNLCGDGFLNCARVLNVGFLVLSALFIFSTAAKFTSRTISGFITLVAIGGAYNSFTAYFMPESMYSCLFWVTSFLLLRAGYSSRYLEWTICAVAFGLFSLVKPHALFLLPAYCLYIIYLKRQAPTGGWIEGSFLTAGFFLLAALATKFGLGYVLAGPGALTLFGSIYGSTASDTLGDLARYSDIARLAVLSIAGHFVALAVLVGVGIAATAVALSGALSRGTHETQKLAVYVVCVFATLVPITALFTSAVSNTGPYETAYRLHMRYYDFALPLLLIVVAAGLDKQFRRQALWLPLLSGAVVALGIIYAAGSALTHAPMHPFTPAFVDGPEIRGLSRVTGCFLVMAGIGLVSLVVWVGRPALGGRLFLFVFAPLSAVISTAFVSAELGNRLVPDVYDRTGQFIHGYLNAAEASKLMVVAPSVAGVLRTLFYIDQPNAHLMIVPDGGQIEPKSLFAGDQWVLTIGTYSLPTEFHLDQSLNGYSLFRVVKPYFVDFRSSSWAGVLTAARGLFPHENWGAWSSNKSVVLEFDNALPRNVIVHLTAIAFGPNVGKVFTMQLGSQAKTFSLSETAHEVSIPFEDVAGAKTLTILIPNPTSPSEIGLSADERKLGIGLVELRVEAVGK